MQSLHNWGRQRRNIFRLVTGKQICAWGSGRSVVIFISHICIFMNISRTGTGGAGEYVTSTHLASILNEYDNKGRLGRHHGTSFHHLQTLSPVLKRHKMTPCEVSAVSRLTQDVKMTLWRDWCFLTGVSLQSLRHPLVISRHLSPLPVQAIVFLIEILLLLYCEHCVVWGNIL